MPRNTIPNAMHTNLTPRHSDVSGTPSVNLPDCFTLGDLPTALRVVSTELKLAVETSYAIRKKTKDVALYIAETLSRYADLPLPACSHMTNASQLSDATQDHLSCLEAKVDAMSKTCTGLRKSGTSRKRSTWRSTGFDNGNGPCKQNYG